MKIGEYFEILKTKDIICLGNGKHFKNITVPFLVKSGLIDNLKGFARTADKEAIKVLSRSYDTFTKEELSEFDHNKTVILIAVTGYEEILNQLSSDVRLAEFEAVPSIYLESLYEDMLLLSAPKPPINYHKNAGQMIPKIIHAIWFSGDPMPQLYLRCLESWKRYAGDYEIRIWDLKTYKPDDCLFFKQAIEHKNWSFASDFARADLLYKYGGIYMDLDVEMLRPVDDLLYNDAYMSFESLERIECGSGMGARPGHPIIREICESYKSRPYLKDDGTWDNSTCPVRYTKVIEKHGLKKDGGFQHVEDITVYPFEVLTGKSFDTGIIYNTELSYTVHHHNGSWIPEHTKVAMTNRYENIRKFLESRGINEVDVYGTNTGNGYS